MLSRRKFIVSAGAVVGARHLVPASAADTASRELDVFIRARMESLHVPGVSLAVLEDGRLLRTAAYGLANVARLRPMRSGTLMNIGSATKTITCTAVMQMWERKGIALEDDVNRHLPFEVRNPAYPNVPITPRQLLTHTSSLRDGAAYGESYGCGDSSVPLGNWLSSYLLPGGSNYDARQNFHPWPPGAQYQYCNVGFGLLGHLVERLAGESYAEYVTKNVFAPLAMSRSRFQISGLDPKSYATAYTYAKDGDISAVHLREPTWAPPANSHDRVLVPHCLYGFATPPDGLARTSARELARLLQAYMNGGEIAGRRVLTPDTVAQILSDQHVHFASDAGIESMHPQGLAWYRLKNVGEGVIWGHTGADPGIRTLMAFRLQDRRGVVVLTNSDDGAQIMAGIAQRVFSTPVMAA